MTSEKAAAHYLARHEHEMEGRGWAVFNPNELPANDLPLIIGFNNGGIPGLLDACLLAEDGVHLGSHACSSVGYMPHDLGVLEGSRPDRHKTFREHYPEGYRMVFLDAKDPLTLAAYTKNQDRRSHDHHPTATGEETAEPGQ